MRPLVRVPAASLSLLLLLGGPAGALTADSVDDFCAVDADPCRVTSVVDVADGTVLDFHRRTIEVTGDGQLRFGPGDTTLRCGGFRTDTKDAALKAGADELSGRFEAGTVTIDARRGCEFGPPELTCTDDLQCELVACGTRRCSLRPTRTCTADAGCQLGPCSGSGRCLGSLSFMRCSSNSDCDLGTCPTQLTCNRMTNVAKDCAVDADCHLGACNVGDASIELSGPVDGMAVFTPEIDLNAVDSVTIHDLVQLSSLDAERDGGTLKIRTVSGDVNLEGRIVAIGGSAARGGAVEVHSGRDLTVGARVNLNGGDFDGGDLDLYSVRDITVRAGVTNSSVRGGGFGGFFTVTAGRDFTLGGSAGDRPVRVRSNGHSANGFGGDGGILDFAATGDLHVGANVRIAGYGAPPESYGSDIVLASRGDLRVDGDLDSRARGSSGYGGALDLYSDGGITIGEDASLRSHGGLQGGGWIVMNAGGPLVFAGKGEAGGSREVGQSVVSLRSDADVEVSGRLKLAGDPDSSIEIDACRIRLADGATLRNQSVGPILLAAHESMNLMPGSALHSPQGSNVLTYRTADKPPTLGGLIDGPPELVVSSGMRGCPVCGNGEVDEFETCDDGNLDPGDGCDENCRLE